MSGGTVLQPQAIRALRRSLGLTQGAFGDRLGVTNVTVSRWESGAFAPDNRAVAALEAMAGATGRNRPKSRSPIPVWISQPTPMPWRRSPKRPVYLSGISQAPLSRPRCPSSTLCRTKG
jgi:transcriptional regulator with XRE-family HTH domain